MPFKFAFIGQDIPMHLPFLLLDFLYGGKEDGIRAREEKNAAMRDVLQHYAEAIVYASGRKAQIIVFFIFFTVCRSYVVSAVPCVYAYGVAAFFRHMYRCGDKQRRKYRK